MLNPSEIIAFWAGIMSDHAEFMLLSLSSRETEAINTAIYYKTAFLQIEEEAKSRAMSPIADPNLISRVYPLLTGFINFKRGLIRRLLKCNIQLGLPPTFINHMINEAMEFHRDLCNIQRPMPMDPTAENVLLHKIWLPDAAGHAAAIAADLDPTEKLLIKEAEKFQKIFDNLFIKAVELGQMLERTGLSNGSLDWLNTEVEDKIYGFICYLEKIKALRQGCKAMGTIDPLIPDHMIREETYYLMNVKSFRH